MGVASTWSMRKPSIQWFSVLAAVPGVLANIGVSAAPRIHPALLQKLLEVFVGDERCPLIVHTVSAGVEVAD
jgi:hypothetical protein